MSKSAAPWSASIWSGIITPDEQLVQYLEVMRRQGRDDYPVATMWNAVLAGVVFQHLSIESLIREFGRNPALLEA